jgi:hypothetical protein
VANHAIVYGGMKAGPTAQVKSSIIALNTSASPTNPQDVAGGVTSLGFNLIGIDGGGAFTAPTDLTGTAAAPLDPRLRESDMGALLLADNGGPTHSIALLCDSPALDRGTRIGINGPLPIDQRGSQRTVDDPLLANAQGGDGTDIGAFEVQEGCAGGRPVPTPRPSPATLDHFFSYGVRVTKGGEPFAARAPVRLADDVSGRDYEVGKPLALALPAAKNGGARLDATTHLLEYHVTAARGTPKFAPRLDVHLLNQCSDVFVAFTKPVSLLVPAAKDLASPVAPPIEATHQLDHFLCYQAKTETKLASGTLLPKPPRRVQVDVQDQFQTRRYDLKGITKVCLPTAKSGNPRFLKGDLKGEPAPFTPATVRHPEALLACYRAKLARVLIPQLGCGPVDPTDQGTKLVPSQPKHAARTGMFVADQLGTLRLDSVKERELCVPSLVAP